MRTTIIVIGAIAVIILLLALLLSRSSADTIPYAVTGKTGSRSRLYAVRAGFAGATS